ncbi:hypothetical protein [Demequina activiva]|uniref:Restriction endonuclease type II-like domain-containing protein n=1 Tax=Demequina activiva TaxID=1582364 RepID=A0A919UIT9_9MICO|nr:hypothetical protein [Demequina activiva]GIG53696.1 hypothetical protein Dac01nite_04480 [Demequina activiva]
MVDYIGRALVADALREWREQLQDRATVSPLRDLVATQASLIDLRSSHPSGLAQLFASRPTAISSLLRDSQAREGGLHRARLIIDEAERVRAATGAWTPALVIGTVAFTTEDGRVEMPLLMRAVGLDRYRADDVQVTLRDDVFLNPVFLSVVRERAVFAGKELTLPQVTAGRDFDPRPLWEAVRGLTELLGDDLEVLDRLLLGVFDDPEQRLLDDLDDCDPVIAASTVLAAAAGDKDAVALLNEPLPAFPRGDRDPFAERGVGDLDDVQFAVLDLIATGRDVFLQAPPGADAVGMAAAVAADGAASGKTVGVVGGADRTLAAITDRLRLLGAPDLVVDATVPQWNAEARARLLESITMGTPQVDDAALRSSGETLLRTRAELHRRFDALHRSHRPWGVSVFEAVQSIVRLTTSDPAPGTTMRLSRDAGAVVAEHGFASVAHAISAVLRPPSEDEPEPVEEPAEPQTSGGDPWWKDAVEPDEGVRLDEALSTLLGRVIPKLRAEAAIAAHETGVDEAGSMDTWVDQVTMFEQLREILEIFSPAVFHRALHDLVAATAPHGSPRHVDLPRRERRALMRRAVELLRPGRGKESLHADLVRAHELALQWRHHCSAGGWPTVPDDYDIFSERVAEAVSLWGTLREPVETALDEADLASAPWDEMVGVLDRLGQGLPGTLEVSSSEPLGLDVEAAGFGPLIEDLRSRDADDAQVRRDLEFAWWAAAFDAIVSSDAALTEYGALGEAVERFRSADAAFAASRIGPLMRAAAERRRTAIARHPDLARDLFAALVEGGEASIKELWRDFGPLASALRPIVVAKAEQVSRLAPPSRVFDVAVVVASESLALAELVPVLARAKQVVVVGDAHAATRSAISVLAAMLPRVTLHATPQPRDVRVTAVLSRAAYGRSVEALPAAEQSGAFQVRHVDGVGAPVAGADAVESTRAEVSAVVEHAQQSHGSLPRHSLMIIAGNDLHAARLREGLRERSSRLAATVPVAVLGDVAGPVVDEVVLSLGFARDSRGTAPRGLGALSESWGREALVQALVATRERLTVFSALDAAHLPADGVEGAGTEDLRDLLQAAGEQAIAPERPEPAPSDWLLSDVAQRLRLAGYAVHVRYGNGPDAVPMVVGGKRDRGYRVAVVTDEAAPAGSASLRDRMRWQRASLEALGWRVVSLWTLDVFMDPDAAADQVMAALEDTGPQMVQEALEIEVPAAPPNAPDGPGEPHAEPAPAPVEVPGMLELDELGQEAPDDVEDEAEPSLVVAEEPVSEEPATEESAPEQSAEDAEEPGESEESEESEESDEPAPPAPRSAGPARSGSAKDRLRGADRPLIPTRASEDVDEGWGGRDHDDRAEELKRERPPHW